MDSPGPATKVLSIVGAGRSGTTILASILGEVPGVVAAGEIRWLWQRGVLEHRSCGCSEPPARCPVWSTVIERVLATPPDADLARLPLLGEILGRQTELDSPRNRLRVIRSADGRGGTWPALDRMREVAEQVCAGLVAATQADVVVDTSKRAQDAAVWAALRSVDHYVLHIVRDPRAVAFSWRRRKPAGPGEVERTMSSRRLLSSVKRWTENCLGAELLRRQLPPHRWLFVRYEDFAAAPRPTVARMLDLLSLSADPPFVGDRTVTLRTNHIVAGNPSRFRTGPVHVRADTEWKRAMTQRDQATVAALTLPLLVKYGYPLRIPRTRDAAAPSTGD